MNDKPEWLQDAIRRAEAQGIAVNWNVVLPSLAGRSPEEAKVALERFLRGRLDAAKARKARRSRKGPPRPRRHGSEGRVEVGVRIVEDPENRGKQIEVLANVKASTLAYMRARDRIDEAQLKAGEWFRGVYERAEIGGVGAIDYSRTRVDGGRITEPLNEALMEAAGALDAVHRLPGIGEVGFSILRLVVGEGVTIERMAASFPCPAHLTGNRAEGWITGRLIECLDILVEHLGLKAKGANRSAVRGERATIRTGEDFDERGRLVPEGHEGFRIGKPSQDA